MARKFIDGFESGQDDLWDAEDNANVISSVGLDMDGDYCLDLNDAYEYVEKDVTANDEMYFAFLYRPTNTSSSEEMIVLYNGSTVLLHLLRTNDATGLIKVHRGLLTLLDTGTHGLTINITYLIEVRFKIADAGGRVEVKVDGVSDIDFTGDTKEGADTQFNKVRLGFGPHAVYSVYAYFDNFKMDDAAWIGDTKIQAIKPTGAGNSTNWTPSAGVNWACVDERPASDVDYVSIDDNDITDTYETSNLAGSVGDIKCVQIQSRTESDGSPTPTNLKLVARCSGGDYVSGNKAVPADPKGLWNLWETDPSDAGAWTEADVNAMEIGIKSAA